jgi:hypothetical protein
MAVCAQTTAEASEQAPLPVLVARLRISAHRGRDFSVIVDGVSAGSWTTGVARK